MLRAFARLLPASPAASPAASFLAGLGAAPPAAAAPPLQGQASAKGFLDSLGK